MTDAPVKIAIRGLTKSFGAKHVLKGLDLDIYEGENLIDNALKYTPENGAVTLALSVDDGRITTRVFDTGPGINADDLPRIFDRFFQINPARGHSANGAGLGLAIAQRILQLHDGAIAVESRPGHGTSFSFLLTTTTP